MKIFNLFNRAKPAPTHAGLSLPPEAKRKIKRAEDPLKSRIPVEEIIESLDASVIETEMRDAVNRGLYARPAWLFHEMANIVSALGEKVEFWLAQIGQLDWQISSTVDEKTEADSARISAAQAQIALLKERYDRIQNLPQAIKHLAGAKFYGFSVIHKNGERLDPISPWNVIHDIDWTNGEPSYKWYFDQKAEGYFRPGEMKEMGDDFAILERQSGGLLIALLRIAFRLHKIMDYRECALERLRRNQCIVLTGGALPDVGSQEYTNLQAALKMARNGESAVIAKGDPECPTEVIWPSTQGNDVSAYEAALRTLNEDMVRAVTCGQLTMLSQATGIGSGNASAHMATLQTLVEDAAMEIKAFLWEEIDKPALQNAGLLQDGERPLAYFDLRTKDGDRRAVEADLLYKIRAAGFRVRAEEASALLGIQVTDPEAEAQEAEERAMEKEAAHPVDTPEKSDGKSTYQTLVESGGLDNRAKPEDVEGLVTPCILKLLEDLRKELGGDEYPDEAWFKKLAEAIDNAPPDKLIDADKLEEYLRVVMKKATEEKTDANPSEN